MTKPKTKKWSLKDLRDKLLSNQEINKQHFNTKFERDTEFPQDTNIKTLYKDTKELSKFPAFNNDICDLTGEKWRKYGNNEELKVSNLGRLKYNDEILELVEEYANGGENHVGYLQISKEKYEKEESWDIIKEKYVYQVVARVWFETSEISEKMDKGWIVHHIDNDGYNNNIENLILLQKCQHQYIHIGNDNKECCIRCAKCKVKQEYYKEGNVEK